MTHHRHTVERRLTIEEDGVAVDHMTVHHVALEELEGAELRLRDVLQRDRASVGALNGLRARVLVRSVLDKRVHPVDVEGRDALREGQIHRDLVGNTELLDGDVRVRRDHGTGGELHALALEIVADATLLRAEALADGLEGATRTLSGLTDTRQIVVHEGGDVELEQQGPLVDRALLRALRDETLEVGVGLDNVDELLCEIVLRALVVVLEHGGTHLRRRDGEYSTHHPVGAAPEPVESHKVHVLVADTAEEAVYVLGLQKAAHSAIGAGRGGLARETLPFRNDPTEVLVMVTVGLARTAAVLRLLAAAGHLLAGREDELPAVFALGAAEGLRGLLADEELRALDTDTAEDLEDHLVELDLVDRAGEFVVAEVAGAGMIVLAAGVAELAVLQYAHSGIGETADFALLGAVRRHFHHRAASDLLGAEHPELDAHDGFRVGTV